MFEFLKTVELSEVGIFHMVIFILARHLENCLARVSIAVMRYHDHGNFFLMPKKFNYFTFGKALAFPDSALLQRQCLGEWRGVPGIHGACTLC